MYVATCRHGVQVAGTCGIVNGGALPNRAASAIEFAEFVQGCMDRGHIMARCNETVELTLCPACRAEARIRAEEKGGG
jgi:hypothetical protein